ncbi:hypothetical protein CGA24_00015 (plasmid) [Salmonella enterica subsp. enterica]|nr:hypothetical protein CGA24_00015 [Salmonella enterica subsp. enterica]
MINSDRQHYTCDLIYSMAGQLKAAEVLSLNGARMRLVEPLPPCVGEENRLPLTFFIYTCAIIIVNKPCIRILIGIVK